jgi:molybdopterin converting factor small subunit
MKVKITYFGPIKYLVGLDEEWIELSKSTVEELLAQLSAKHGNIFYKWSDNSPRSRNYNIFINGRHILEFENNTMIKDGSEVSIVLVSQAAGG